MNIHLGRTLTVVIAYFSLSTSSPLSGSDLAIIGGYSDDGMGNRYPYAALLSPTGEASLLTGPALPVGLGSILSVDINHSGAAIIGGYDNASVGYAALVSPSCLTTALS